MPWRVSGFLAVVRCRKFGGGRIVRNLSYEVPEIREISDISVVSEFYEIYEISEIPENYEISEIPDMGPRRVDSVVLYVLYTMLMVYIIIKSDRCADGDEVSAWTPLAPSLFDALPGGEGGVRVVVELLSAQRHTQPQY